MKIQIAIICGSIVLFSSCGNKQSEEIDIKEKNNIHQSLSRSESDKIQVLNFGTFHMGLTSDGTKTEFDEHDLENQKRVHEIARMLSSFKPTVILVEKPPEQDSLLQLEYTQYLKNPKMFFKNSSEIELLAYELGRICEAKRIYGIDHKMNYNYRIWRDLQMNTVDSTMVKDFYGNKKKYFPVLAELNNENLSLLDRLKLKNRDSYLDYLITTNADILSYAASEGNFEGADEAAKYYQRNLRMFTNMNRIKLSNEDRVFIIMGASHTAFFRDFIGRSPKYKMVNTFDYLK
jgi:hypothetical protein